jgi:hypothetical protein
MDDADILVALAGVRLGDLAPAPVEQDDDGLYASFGWRIGRNESPHEFPRSQGWGQAFSLSSYNRHHPPTRCPARSLRQMKTSTGRIPDYQPSGTSV